jgi:hypothetical protein
MKLGQPQNQIRTAPGGLFLLVVVLGLGLLLLLLLLLLLGLLGQWRLERFLLFGEPPPVLCYVENEGALPFKGDFGRKLLALLRSASVLFRSGTRHGHSLMVAYRTDR